MGNKEAAGAFPQKTVVEQNYQELLLGCERDLNMPCF